MKQLGGMDFCFVFVFIFLKLFFKVTNDKNLFVKKKERMNDSN